MFLKNKEIEEFARYAKCFVFQEDFEDRRFDRYAKKVKDQLDTYINNLYSIIESTNSKSDIMTHLYIYLMGHFSEDKMNEYAGYKISSKKMISNHFYKYGIKNTFIDKEEFKNIFSDSDEDNQILFGLLETEFRNACKLYIAKKCIGDKTIAIDSYHSKTLPIQKTEELFDIMNNTLNWTAIDIERLILEASKEDYFQKSNNKEVLELRKYIEEEDQNIGILNNTIKEQEKLITEKENVIKNLNKKIEILETREKDIKKELIEENEILTRQNLKLKDKYNELLSKYKTLKTNSNENSLATETNNDSETELKDLDLNGRYVFVLKDATAFLQNIKDTFPNATFIESNTNLNPNAIDMVIVISSHIDHTTYYAIKNQCKTKDIPFIHCEHSNIELIKNMMWTHLEL